MSPTGWSSRKGSTAPLEITSHTLMNAASPSPLTLSSFGMTFVITIQVDVGPYEIEANARLCRREYFRRNSSTSSAR